MTRGDRWDSQASEPSIWVGHRLVVHAQQVIDALVDQFGRSQAITLRGEFAVEASGLAQAEDGGVEGSHRPNPTMRETIHSTTGTATALPICL